MKNGKLAASLNMSDNDLKKHRTQKKKNSLIKKSKAFATFWFFTHLGATQKIA